MAGGDEDNFIFTQFGLVALVGHRPVLEGAVAIAFAVIFVYFGVVDARGAGFGVNAVFAERLARFASYSVEELVFGTQRQMLGKC